MSLDSGREQCCLGWGVLSSVSALPHPPASNNPQSCCTAHLQAAPAEQVHVLIQSSKSGSVPSAKAACPSEGSLRSPPAGCSSSAWHQCAPNTPRRPAAGPASQPSRQQGKAPCSSLFLARMTICPQSQRHDQPGVERAHLQPVPCQASIVALHAVHKGQQQVLLDGHEGVAIGGLNVA